MKRRGILMVTLIALTVIGGLLAFNYESLYLRLWLIPEAREELRATDFVNGSAPPAPVADALLERWREGDVAYGQLLADPAVGMNAAYRLYLAMERWTRVPRVVRGRQLPSRGRPDYEKWHPLRDRLIDAHGPAALRFELYFWTARNPVSRGRDRTRWAEIARRLRVVDVSFLEQLIVRKVPWSRTARHDPDLLATEVLLAAWRSGTPPVRRAAGRSLSRFIVLGPVNHPVIDPAVVNLEVRHRLLSGFLQHTVGEGKGFHPTLRQWQGFAHSDEYSRVNYSKTELSSVAIMGIALIEDDVPRIVEWLKRDPRTSLEFYRAKERRSVMDWQALLRRL